LRIESRAPTRVDLAGGTLIFATLSLSSGRVDHQCGDYAVCKLCDRNARRRRQESAAGVADTKREEGFASFDAMVKAKHYKLPLLAEIAKFFRPEGGFTLTTGFRGSGGRGNRRLERDGRSDLPRQVDRFTSAGKSKVDWIHISRDAEGIVIKYRRERRIIIPPPLAEQLRLNCLQAANGVWNCGWILATRKAPCALLYGKPRQSGINNWEVFKAHIDGKRKVMGNLERIPKWRKRCAARWKKRTGKRPPADARRMAFRKKNLPDDFDEDGGPHHRKFAEAGALSGKVCGAGGGGCVVLAD